MTRVLAVFLLLATLGMAAVLLAAWREAQLLTSPPGYRHPLPPGFAFAETPRSQHGLDFEEVAFPAADGTTLRGWLVPGSQPERLVILLHGRGGDRRHGLAMLPAIQAAGASALLFDLRENGLSDGAGRGTGLGMLEAEEAVAAVAAMRRRGAERILLQGCSLGASAAIIAAAREPAVGAILADSALASMPAFVADLLRARARRAGLSAPGWLADGWGELVVALAAVRRQAWPLLSAERAAAAIRPRPLLLVHGALDEVVLPAHAAAILAKAGDQASLWLVPDAGHCQPFYAAPALYAQQIARLLQAARPVDAARR